MAVEAGAEGIVVSNHGGRQLDGALSAIKVLPSVVEAVQGRASILMDSGVRSGLDVVRAMALGADGVLIGRAWAYALGARGGKGVAEVLELIRREMQVAMALSGQTDVKKNGFLGASGPQMKKMFARLALGLLGACTLSFAATPRRRCSATSP